MRTFKVVKPIPNEYISCGEEYKIDGINDPIYYCRNQLKVSCSFMSLSRFKRALHEGAIVFTN